VTRALTDARKSSEASTAESFLHVGSSPLEMSTTTDCRKGERSQSKMYMRRRIDYEKGDPNLASNRSFLAGRRWPSFLPDFPDKHFPHLSVSSGGNSIRRPFPLGGQLHGAGLDPHDAF
jgi:hypothetical protein